MRLSGLTLIWLLLGGWSPAQPGSDSPDAILSEARRQHAEGRLRRAEELYLDALPGLRSADQPNRLAQALDGLSLTGIAFGRYQQARNYAEEAVGIWEQLGDGLGQSASHNNLGLAYYHLGDFESALRHYRRALELDSADEDPEGQVIYLNNIANVHLLKGEYTEALRVYQEARRRIGDHAGEPWAAHERSRTLANLATLFQKLGLYQRALDIYGELRAADVLSSRERGQVLINLGALYRHLGDPYKALETYAEARDVLGRGPWVEARISVFKNIGIVQALDFGALAPALTAFREARDLAESAGDRREWMQSRLYIAEALRRMGDDAAAEAEFGEVLELARAMGTPEETWKALFGLAQVALRQGDSSDGVRLLEEAVEVIESLRSRLEASSLGRGFLAEKRQVYDALLNEQFLRFPRDASALSEAASLLRLMERSRSQSFDLAPETKSQRPQPEAQRLRELEAELSELWKQQAANPDDSEQWRTRIVELENDYLETERRLAPQSSASVLSFTIEDLRRGLPDSALLLSYWLGENALGRVQLSRGQLQVTHHALTEQDRSRLKECIRRLSTPESDWIEPCRRSSQLLLEDLNLAGVGTVIVASDQWLNRLPMGVLSLPGDAAPLLRRADVWYLPSLRPLVESSQPRWNRWPWATTLVAVADPEFRPGAAELLNPTWERLPGARREAESISERLPGAADLLVGEAASKNALLGRLKRGIPILHLATHAVADPAVPERSRILLAPADPDAAGDFLFLREVATSQMGPVDTVVLSACETAVGPGGAESFSRALLGRGARSVVATLWRVEDESGAVLMESFYALAVGGLSKSEALRRAQIRFLDSNSVVSHPYYWAGYVLSGAGADPLPLPWAWSQLAVFGLLVAVAASVLVVMLLRTKPVRSV